MHWESTYQTFFEYLTIKFRYNKDARYQSIQIDKMTRD